MSSSQLEKAANYFLIFNVYSPYLLLSIDVVKGIGGLAVKLAVAAGSPHQRVSVFRLVWGARRTLAMLTANESSGRAYLLLLIYVTKLIHLP